MPPKEMNVSTIYFTDLKTGEKFELTSPSIIDYTIEKPKENKLIHFRDYSEPITFTCENTYIDLSILFTNNWRRRHGKNPLPYRKLFKHNKGYALVIYNRQRKYVRDRYTFDKWKVKKGIE